MKKIEVDERARAALRWLRPDQWTKISRSLRAGVRKLERQGIVEVERRHYRGTLYMFARICARASIGENGFIEVKEDAEQVDG